MFIRTSLERTLQVIHQEPTRDKVRATAYTAYSLENAIYSKFPAQFKKSLGLFNLELPIFPRALWVP